MNTIGTDLPASKLRNLKHYCPTASELQPFAGQLADRIERYEGVISPTELRTEIERVLKKEDPEDYALGAKGALVLMKRLFILEILLDSIVPRDFLNDVRAEYSLPVL